MLQETIVSYIGYKISNRWDEDIKEKRELYKMILDVLYGVNSFTDLSKNIKSGKAIPIKITNLYLKYENKLESLIKNHFKSFKKLSIVFETLKENRNFMNHASFIDMNNKKITYENIKNNLEENLKSVEETIKLIEKSQKGE
jgi:transposase